MHDTGQMLNYHVQVKTYKEIWNSIFVGQLNLYIVIVFISELALT